MADPGAALVDIVGPPPPVSAPTHTTEQLVAVFVVALVFALGVWIIRRWSAWRVRLTLRRLRHAHEAGRIDTREAAFCLAAALRRYFGVMRIDGVSVPPGAGRRWVVVLRRLDRLRYAKPGTSVSLAEQWRRLSAVTARRLARRAPWRPSRGRVP